MLTVTLPVTALAHLEVVAATLAVTDSAYLAGQASLAPNFDSVNVTAGNAFIALAIL